MRSILAASILAASAMPVFAQSAEETVMYLVSGFDGQPVHMRLGKYGALDAAPAGSGTAGLRIKIDMGGREVDYSLDNVRVDDCNYRIETHVVMPSSHGRPGSKSGASILLDFSSVSGLESKPGDASTPFSQTTINGLRTTCSEAPDSLECRGAARSFPE